MDQDPWCRWPTVHPNGSSHNQYIQNMLEKYQFPKIKSLSHPPWPYLWRWNHRHSWHNNRNIRYLICIDLYKHQLDYSELNNNLRISFELLWNFSMYWTAVPSAGICKFCKKRKVWPWNSCQYLQGWIEAVTAFRYSIWHSNMLSIYYRKAKVGRSWVQCSPW
jgi:hypothetical protein